MRKPVLCMLVMALVGCATQYQQRGLSGGYSEQQIDEDTYRVRFAGNAYLSPEKANDYALRRSAELTKSHGYRYFVIIESDREANVDQRLMAPRFSKPTSTLTIRCFRDRPDTAVVYDAAMMLSQKTQ